MFAQISSLRAACRPFVSRVFRGPRLRRTTLASVLLAVITVVMGLGLALGTSSAAREFRVGLAFEPSAYTREYEEFVVIAETQSHYRDLLVYRDDLVRRGHTSDGPLAYVVEPALATVHRAAATPAPAAHAELARRARALAERASMPDPNIYESRSDYGFPWDQPGEVTRLRRIVELDLVPAVELYSSPLRGDDIVRVVAWVAGMVFSLLVLVLAPLLAATQIAQEVHENTLQPLHGTALSSRRLAIGLTSAPLATVAVLVFPLVLIQLLAIPFAHRPWGVALFFAVTLVIGVGLCVAGQLIGLLLGKRRTTGIIGIAMTLVLGIAWLMGFFMARNFDAEMLRAFAFIPHSTALHLVFDAFAPHRASHFVFVFDPQPAEIETASWVYIALDTVGAAILAVVAFRALERRLPEKTRSTLLRKEAALAALVLAAMLPWEVNETYVPTLLMFLPWLLLLVMARIPTGESLAYRPAVLRIPAIEYAVALGVHAVAFTLWRLAAFHDYGLSHAELAVAPLLWCLVAAFLVAARVATKPMTARSAIVQMLTVAVIIIQFVAADSGDIVPEAMIDEFGLPIAVGFLSTLVVLPALLIADLRRAYSPAGS